jgi:hypothetical protein
MGRVARLKKCERTQNVSWKDHVEDLGADGMIILK